MSQQSIRQIFWIIIICTNSNFFYHIGLVIFDFLFWNNISIWNKSLPFNLCNSITSKINCCNLIIPISKINHRKVNVKKANIPYRTFDSQIFHRQRAPKMFTFKNMRTIKEINIMGPYLVLQESLTNFKLNQLF